MGKPRKPRMTKQMKFFAAQMSSVQNFTIKDFQRNCIVRGMPFNDMLEADMNTLRVWLYKEGSKAEINPELLDDFDKWKEDILKKRGLPETYFHSALRLGFQGEEDEEGQVKRKRIKGFKKPKHKKEKTEDGIYAGTKKALTYACCNEGLSIEDTIKKVIGKFPEASPKSINIWYKRRKREQDKEKA